MTGHQPNTDVSSSAPDQDITDVYGTPERSSDDLTKIAGKRHKFSAWHHPVKQVVRTYQWMALTSKLLKERPSQVLRYFSLPGDDLLDIKVLAEACTKYGTQIEYFGFNSGAPSAEENTTSETAETEHISGSAPWVAAESALRQADRITQDSIIYTDRLEDIAEDRSQAATQLSQRSAFDVINIDACDHLAYSPAGRKKTIFNALEALLKHQLMKAQNPWLLFLTTRADPSLLGDPGLIFQHAVTQNLQMPSDEFKKSLAECLGAQMSLLGTAVANAWNTHDERFLKLYSVGIGKFLLQFFCGQPNLPADVELVSAYAYRVRHDHPDMLALAFRITPKAQMIFPPSTGGSVPVPPLEPKLAAIVAQRAMKLWDLDDALNKDAGLREEAILGTVSLLKSAKYEIDEWCTWLASHGKRPLQVDFASLPVT